MVLRLILLMGIKNMNKLLLVEDIKDIQSTTLFLTLTKNATLNIFDEVNLSNYLTTNANLTLNLKPASHLNFTQVSELTKDINLTFNLEENSHLEYNLVLLNKGCNTIFLDINMPESNSTSNIKVRSLNLTSTSNLNLICNGYIAKNTQNNELLEDLKGLILNNDTIKISPNMYIDSEEVLANHLVTISSFNPEEIFYLMEHGLSLKSSQDLLLKGYLTAILNPELKEKIPVEVINNE